MPARVPLPGRRSQSLLPSPSHNCPFLCRARSRIPLSLSAARSSASPRLCPARHELCFSAPSFAVLSPPPPAISRRTFSAPPVPRLPSGLPGPLASAAFRAIPFQKSPPISFRRFAGRIHPRCPAPPARGPAPSPQPLPPPAKHSNTAGCRSAAGFIHPLHPCGRLNSVTKCFILLLKCRHVYMLIQQTSFLTPHKRIIP